MAFSGDCARGCTAQGLFHVFSPALVGLFVHFLPDGLNRIRLVVAGVV